jgi:hypothetical protein
MLERAGDAQVCSVARDAVMLPGPGAPPPPSPEPVPAGAGTAS